MRGGQAVARLHGDVELLRGVSAGAEGRDNFIRTETFAWGRGAWGVYLLNRLFRIIPWTPFRVSTSCVMWKSAATEASM